MNNERKLNDLLSDICAKEGVDQTIYYLSNSLTSLIVYKYIRKHPQGLEPLTIRTQDFFNSLLDATREKYKVAMEKELWLSKRKVQN